MFSRRAVFGVAAGGAAMAALPASADDAILSAVKTFPGGLTVVDAPAVDDPLLMSSKQLVALNWMTAYHVYEDDARQSLKVQGGDLWTFKLASATLKGACIEFVWQCRPIDEAASIKS